jgi:anaerobic selenocysteine-containing dehydrogenase
MRRNTFLDGLNPPETVPRHRNCTTHASHCDYCFAECGILVEVRGGQAVDVRGDADHVTSRAYVCSKGHAICRAHHDPRRLDHAPIGRGMERRSVALDTIHEDRAYKLDCIRAEHGPDALAIYYDSGGQMDFLVGTLAEKFTRALGTRCTKLLTVLIRL